ncbi:hypothetical protein N7475_008095 [Penicillium sp. IBT 31633x]|nr:hypothetical protein N7475_008095 [Penicillium sp. IBT 31633x]
MLYAPLGMSGTAPLSCDTCLPAKIHDAPGIGIRSNPLIRPAIYLVGIKISFSCYEPRTAVVHYYNGTVLEVAKIPENRISNSWPVWIQHLSHLPIQISVLRVDFLYNH